MDSAKFAEQRREFVESVTNTAKLYFKGTETKDELFQSLVGLMNGMKTVVLGEDKSKPKRQISSPDGLKFIAMLLLMQASIETILIGNPLYDSKALEDQLVYAVGRLASKVFLEN